MNTPIVMYLTCGRARATSRDPLAIPPARVLRLVWRDNVLVNTQEMALVDIQKIERDEDAGCMVVPEVFVVKRKVFEALRDGTGQFAGATWHAARPAQEESYAA